MIIESGSGVNIQYVPFPDGVSATHTENEDGSFTIFINERISESAKWCAYLHELYHIKCGHLQSDTPADIIELMTAIGMDVIT